MISEFSLVIVVCLLDRDHFAALMLPKDLAHGASWLLTSQTKDIESLILMLVANGHVLYWWRCRFPWRFVNWLFWLLGLGQLARIHVDNVLDEQITRQAVHAVAIDHYFKTTRGTLKLATREADHATATFVAFFGAFAAEIVLTWQNDHGFRENLKNFKFNSFLLITYIQANWTREQAFNVFGYAS